jgi:hypothetical protein
MNEQNHNFQRPAPRKRIPVDYPINEREREIYDRIFRRAYQEGYNRGYHNGYHEGHAIGYEDALYNQQNAMAGKVTNMKWHGRKSRSWSWL